MSAQGAVAARRVRRQPSFGRTRSPFVRIREARVSEAPTLFRLISANLEAGHLLPRSLDELTVHAPRFFVATHRRAIIGCAELAPLSRVVAEVRSLVVDERYRGVGVGTRLVDAIRRRARLDGFETLCAFTHDATPFVRLGFSIVPHVWLPEKIATDCHHCALFRRCGQYAMVAPLASPARVESDDRSATLLTRGVRLQPDLVTSG